MDTSRERGQSEEKFILNAVDTEVDCDARCYKEYVETVNMLKYAMGYHR